MSNFAAQKQKNATADRDESPRQRIFISYARRDGADLALKLQKDLEVSAPFDVWLDKQRIAGGESWTVAIEEAIDRAEVVLALLTPASYISEICRAEQLRSLRKGKCVIPLLARPGSDIPLHLEPRNYRDFTEPQTYDSVFQSLLGDIERGDGVALAERYRTTPAQYITARPQVPNYIPRPDAISALRDTLFASDGHSAIALTALEGMGGIGKTVLARALFQDEVVLQAFPDGLVWIALGREPTYNLPDKLREIVKVLGGAIDEAVGPETLYRTAVANKAALIVIDDVWRREDMVPFLADSRRSRFLFTTRDASIALSLGAREHRVDLLGVPEARELLAVWAGRESADLPAQADAVLRECNGLPLALSTVGAMLREAASVEWADTVNLLRTADLSAIEEHLPPGQQSFFRTIDVSVKALPEEMRQRYGKLAVLLDDIPAPVSVLRTLWGVNEADARRFARRLADRSLVLRDPEGGIRLHDLQLDYIRANATDRKALGLIRAAARQSAHVIEKDPGQFAGHLIARLLQHRGNPSIQRFLEEVAAGAPRPWLKPLTASLSAERSIRWIRPALGESLDNLAFSSNGRWAAHVSGSGEPADVVLWDLAEWRSRGPHFRTLARLHPFALALSDNAQWCLYADSIGGLHRLGDAGEVWEGHGHRKLTIARLIAIGADGRRAVSACQHGRLVAWDIDAGSHEVIWEESGNCAVALSLDPAGASALVARSDGSVHLVDLWPLQDRILCTLDRRPVALARSADGATFAAATDEGRIEIRSIHSAGPPTRLFQTEANPSCLAISPERRHLAVGTDAGTVEVWSLTRGVRTARYRRAHTYKVQCVSFSQDGLRLVSADILHIKEWELEAPEGSETGVAGSRAQGEVTVTENGLHALAVLQDGRLGVWDVRTGALQRALSQPEGLKFGDASIGPAERLLVAAKAPRVLAWNHKLLCVWDVDAGILTGSRRVEDAADAALTPDGNAVVYLDGNDVTLWRPDEDKSVILGTYRSDRPGYVAVSPDGKLALSSGGDRQVYLWRLQSPALRDFAEEIRRLAADVSFLPDASYWPDARDKPAAVAFAGPKQAIITTGDGSLFVLNVSEQDPVRAGRPPRITLAGAMLEDRHASWINRLILHSDGKLFVTSSADGTVKLWDFDRGCTIGTLDAHVASVARLSVSTGRILFNSRDGVLKLSSLDGALLAAFQGDYQFSSCDSDANIESIVALDQRGQVHFFHLESED